MTSITTVPYGDAAVMLTALGSGPDARARVRQLGALLQERAPHGVTDAIAGLDSLLISFDPQRTTTASITDFVALLDDTTAPVAASDIATTTGRLVHIPVVFDAGTGPDLDAVAAEQDTTVDAIIAAATEVTFTTVLLAAGMAPMMEGGAFPTQVRRATQPRTNVPAGSIMIAGQNAIIQPSPGPTGWRVIGRTPHTIVDITRDNAAAIAPGDRVQFVPVSRDDAANLEGVFLETEPTR